jgi:hypothetical protein
MSFKEVAGTTMGCAFALLVIPYGLIQIYAGYIGIVDKLGAGWAIAAVVAFMMLRFSLPLTIGSFFAARDIWGWHWGGALVFAAPGLAFMALMIPGVFASLFRKSKE